MKGERQVCRSREMGLDDILRKAAVKQANNGRDFFSVPAAKQKEFLGSFDEPADDLERSYFQYRCQRMLAGHPFRAFLTDLASFLLMHYYLIRHGGTSGGEHADAVFFADGKPDNIIPGVLRNSYDKWINISDKNGCSDKDDRAFFRRLIRRYPFSWTFLLKCLIKLRYYSYVIKKHSPKAIVVCAEYSYTSSFLTAYCAHKGVKHIDVMHGEKLFSVRDSFFRYDSCYVWDKAYAQLFARLRAKEDQFIVAVPGSMDFSGTVKCEKTADYVYYLANETGQMLRKVFDCLTKLREKGFTVRVRPHPRYSVMDEVSSLCKETGIACEDTKSVTIEQSVMSAGKAIAYMSTVLNQAYHNGVGVVIDDVSRPEKLEVLKEFEYSMLYVGHTLLSEEINA